MSQSTTERVTANIRAELARMSLTHSDFARSIGMNQQAFSRRMVGRVAFTVDELETVAKLLGLPASALLADRANVA